MKNYVPNISGFVDFCSYHSNGEPIFFVGGRLYAGFDMFVKIEYRYNFVYEDSRSEIEKAITENLYMFDIKMSSRFYYPNNNMFSMSNAMEDIKGMVLTLKSRYK